MKILITGASGLLGRSLVKILPYQIIKCCNQQLQHYEHFDVTNRDLTISTISKHNPDIIIHCAAIGSVDKVQSDFKLGLAVNLEGTINVIKAAQIINSKIIMISTNAVFNGQEPPYNEVAHLCPLSNYGIIKAAAELAIRSSGLDWMIIRPILMYGNPNLNQRDNWVTIWVDRLRKQQECIVVNDTVTQPLYNDDCAQVINKAITKQTWNEIFHVSGADRISLYDFATIVADVYQLNKNLIIPVRSSYFTNIAPRPRDTSYDLTKIKTILNHDPLGVHDGLQMMKIDNDE